MRLHEPPSVMHHLQCAWCNKFVSYLFRVPEILLWQVGRVYCEEGWEFKLACLFRILTYLINKICWIGIVSILYHKNSEKLWCYIFLEKCFQIKSLGLPYFVKVTPDSYLLHPNTYLTLCHMAKAIDGFRSITLWNLFSSTWSSVLMFSWC